MKLLLAFLTIATCFPSLASGEEYDNPAYGINLRAVGDWKFSRTAKLEVNLHDLSNEQLDELFQSYQGWGVVRMVKGDGNDRAWIMIQFTTPRGEIKSAVEQAEGYESGAKSRNEEILVSAIEKSLAGIPAAYLATGRTSGRQKKTSVAHQFLVRRTRSYVVITGVFPGDNSESHLNDFMDALASLKIDVDADSRRAD